MNDSNGFAVLLLQRGPRDPLPIAKALAASRKTPLQDQMLAARNAWGVVANDLAEADARALAEVLNAAGVESGVVPASLLVDLPKPEPAVKWDAFPAGPASLIAVAGVEVITESKSTETKGPSGTQKMMSTAIKMSTGIPINIGGKTRKVEVTKEEKSLSFFADVIYREPFRRLRVAASKFDYSCLKERKLFQAQGNLKLLVGDLVRASPDAWHNHGATVLLEAKPMQTMGYTSLADLDKEERWLLALQHLGSAS